MRSASLVFLLSLLLFNQRTSFSQTIKNTEVKFLLDSCITVMRCNSVNASQIQWPALKTNVYKMASDLNSPYELGNVMRYLLKSLKDNHGAFFYKDSMFKWEPKQPSISDSIKNEWNKRSGIKRMILSNNVGYLRVPSMPGDSKSVFDEKAQSLNDSLCYLLERNVKGIVLDLRINGGGAMFPMILGLKQLLQSGKLGSFDTGKQKEEEWLVSGDNFLVDTTVLTTIHQRCTINAGRLPVVILTSNATASSGEFLIMAFKGRKNIVLIGTPTNGLITVNNGFQINDSTFMNLSVGYGKDRNGNVYRTAIKPDISIKSPDSFNDINNDRKVKAAIKWINSR